jgi:hypothetical protein
MFFRQYIPLQLQILKLFILLLVFVLEYIGQLSRFIGKLVKHFIIVFMRLLVEFLELDL